MIFYFMVNILGVVFVGNIMRWDDIKVETN